MSESQNTEYKQVWKDDYIRWICGFANANGGKISLEKMMTGKLLACPMLKIDGRNTTKSS